MAQLSREQPRHRRRPRWRKQQSADDEDDVNTGNGQRAAMATAAAAAATANFLRTTAKAAAAGVLRTTAALHSSAPDRLSFPTDSEGRIRCTLVPGDGVGPELVDSVQQILKTTGAPVAFETYHLSEASAVLRKVNNA